MRMRRLPARYQDIYPEPPLPAASSDPSYPETTVRVVPRVTLIVRNPFHTAPNSFGLWKEYMYRPSCDPDASISTKDLYRPHTSTIVPEEEVTIDETPDEALESGYSNKSIELLMYWQTTGSTQKTDKEVNRLICEVIRHPEFKPQDFAKFNATCENQKANAADEKSPSYSHSDKPPSGGWMV